MSCCDVDVCVQSRKSSIIRESNQASAVLRRITHSNYVGKSSILLAGNGVRSSVACGFSPIKIHSDYQKSLISRINEDYVFFKKISL